MVKDLENPLQQVLHTTLNLVTRETEGIVHLEDVSPKTSWVGQCPVLRPKRVRQGWTIVASVSAKGDDVIEFRKVLLCQVIAGLVFDVHSDLMHGPGSMGIQSLRIRAGTVDVNFVASIVARKSFRYLASCRIPATDEENAPFLGHLKDPVSWLSAVAPGLLPVLRKPFYLFLRRFPGLGEPVAHTPRMC